MANFTEKQIQGMIAEIRDMFGSDIATRELALLELEDMKRKGALSSMLASMTNAVDARSLTSVQWLIGISAILNMPMMSWHKRCAN